MKSNLIDTLGLAECMQQCNLAGGLSHKDLRGRSLIFFAFIFMSFLTIECVAQYSWDWRDPNDLNIVDFGDNKVIAYNLIGLGLVTLFDKKMKSDSSVLWSLGAGNFHEYKREPLSQLILLETRVGRPMRSYLDWGVGVRFTSTYGEGERTSGLGTFLWFSWHIVRKEKWRITYDNGVGPNFFFKPFPDGGTRFNFTTHYGIELAFKANERWITLLFSNIHISNGGIKGRDRNPALDAIGIRLGYQL